MATTLTINGTDHTVDLPPEVPLLWVLRDAVGLTGTKFGCGVAACGACTVHIDGQAVRSCLLFAVQAQGSDVVTVEGLGADSTPLLTLSVQVDAASFQPYIDAAAEHGIAAIIQPGGSMRDDEVIQAANEHGLAMVFTGMRHFRH